MQTLRDAFLLLVVILIVGTVRISPAPEVRLSLAQAAESAQATPAQAEVEFGSAARATTVDGPALAEPDEGRRCAESLAVQVDRADRDERADGASPRACPKAPVIPCEA